MLTILNFLNANNLFIFQQILMILVSKFMVHRALSDKTYLLLGLLSPLSLHLSKCHIFGNHMSWLFFCSFLFLSAFFLLFIVNVLNET